VGDSCSSLQSKGVIEFARNLAVRDGFEHINFLVHDLLESKLERRFGLVMDEGNLDAIGLHLDGPVKRMMYTQSVASLVSHGGILVSSFSFLLLIHLAELRTTSCMFIWKLLCT